jgi:hypothetical protein
MGVAQEGEYPGPGLGARGETVPKAIGSEIRVLHQSLRRAGIPCQGLRCARNGRIVREHDGREGFWGVARRPVRGHSTPPLHLASSPPAHGRAQRVTAGSRWPLSRATPCGSLLCCSRERQEPCQPVLSARRRDKSLKKHGIHPVLGRTVACSSGLSGPGAADRLACAKITAGGGAERVREVHRPAGGVVQESLAGQGSAIQVMLPLSPGCSGK